MKKQAHLLKNNMISIIIPIYNSEQYINKCLNSLVNQAYSNIEIICINDGSKDNSLNILKKYQKKDKRIKIIDKQNEGVSAARNDGLNAATGDYITFVDADDWLEPHAIETLYQTIKKYKVDVVRGNYYINYSDNDNENLEKGNQYDLNNKTIYTNQKDFETNVIDKLLNGTLPCFIWLLLIKKDILRNIRFKENIKYMEDTIFYNELMNNINSIHFLDEPLYHYFDNQSSCTRSNEYYIRNMYNIIDVNKELTNIITNNSFYTKNRIKLINTTHLNLIMNYFYQMYKTTYKNKTELIFEINKILENENIKKITQNINLNYLPYHQKISINLILKRKYKLLFVFYNIRIFLSNFKK